VSARTKYSENINVRPARLYKSQARSRVTNGVDLLPNVDGRSLWVRRYRDIVAMHTADLGGDDNITAAERALVRRAACLVVELETLECKFAQEGAPKGWQFTRYLRACNSLRRLLVSLGLQRRSKDVTPDLDTYLHMKTIEDDEMEEAE
jgi:hypothetical protein